MHEISRRNPSRMALVTPIFILGCLLSSARLIIDAPALHQREGDVIAQRSDVRFAAPRIELPPRGVIGYIGESGDPTADYYLAQYALAPLVVDRSLNHALVIGNFPSAPPPVQVEGLRLVKDFGNGVLLFARKEQP